MLSFTAIFWGAGFVLNDNLLTASFDKTPNLLNAIRFFVATILLCIVFAKKLRCNKHILLYSSIGGAMLFGGFTLQILGLRLSTPSHNGFFTASYIIFVPFITWIFRKQRPSWQVFVSIAIAIAGLAILNISFSTTESKNTLYGDLLTLCGAVLFASQIVWTDFALKKDDINYVDMTVWQVLFAAVLFALYTVIFESKNYSAIVFDSRYCIWRLIIVSVGGTAFAYFSQSYAQNHLAPSETSLVLACESPIGAVISILVGAEVFVWNTAVGGALVIISVAIIELLPYLHERRKKKNIGQKEEKLQEEQSQAEKSE